MTRLILPARFTQQPAGNAPLNSRFGTVFADTPCIGAGAKTSVTIASGYYGQAYSFSGGATGSSLITYGTADALNCFTDRPGWMLLVFNPGDSVSWAANNNAIAHKSNALGTTGWGMFHQTSGAVFWDIDRGGFGRTTSVTGALTSKTWVTLLCVYNGAFGSANWGKTYINGIDKTSTSTAGSGSATDELNSLTLGSDIDGGSGTDSIGQVALFAMGRGTYLNASQAAELSANPWQVFQQPRKLWVALPATNMGANEFPAATTAKKSAQLRYDFQGWQQTPRSADSTGPFPSKIFDLPYPLSKRPQAWTKFQDWQHSPLSSDSIGPFTAQTALPYPTGKPLWNRYQDWNQNPLAADSTGTFTAQTALPYPPGKPLWHRYQDWQHTPLSADSTGPFTAQTALPYPPGKSPWTKFQDWNQDPLSADSTGPFPSQQTELAYPHRKPLWNRYQDVKTSPLAADSTGPFPTAHTALPYPTGKAPWHKFQDTQAKPLAADSTGPFPTAQTALPYPPGRTPWHRYQDWQARPLAADNTGPFPSQQTELAYPHRKPLPQRYQDVQTKPLAADSIGPFPTQQTALPYPPGKPLWSRYQDWQARPLAADNTVAFSNKVFELPMWRRPPRLQTWERAPLLVVSTFSTSVTGVSATGVVGKTFEPPVAYTPPVGIVGTVFPSQMGMTGYGVVGGVTTSVEHPNYAFVFLEGVSATAMLGTPYPFTESFGIIPSLPSSYTPDAGEVQDASRWTTLPLVKP